MTFRIWMRTLNSEKEENELTVIGDGFQKFFYTKM
jgi:hypothetical protein